MKLHTESTLIIQVLPQTLWQVLTESEFTRQYLFNCSVNSQWINGSTIEWEGWYQGYRAYQKGHILEIEPYTLLKYSTFDPYYGLEDVAENYVHVTYLLQELEGSTLLTIRNETFDGNKDRIKHVQEGWEMVAGKLKETAETHILSHASEH